MEVGDLSACMILIVHLVYSIRYQVSGIVATMNGFLSCMTAQSIT